ncbi:MAG: cell division protein FtsQ/DivIB [Chthoniobacterales bacterium]
MAERPRARNQRISNTRVRRRQHLLDVKVRSHKATRHRNRRIIVFVSKIALALAVCAGVAAGVRFGAKRLFFENPDYRLSTVDVQTDGTLQREQVLKAANLADGINIFSVNLARVHDDLQQLPQVDEVQVVRKMPSEIDIVITERKPIAWITADKELNDPFASEGAFLIDARGVLMKQKKLLPEYLGLPLITGCSSESLEPGKTVASFEARAALELLRLSTRSFMQTRFQIREIDVSKGYCLTVSDKTHARVTFAFDNLEAQLQRLEQFLVWADDSQHEIETVNLLVQRNVPVTFAKPASEVINETIDPNEQPRIMRAIPVHPGDAPKSGAAIAPKQKADPEQPRTRRAIPVHKGKKG